MKIGDSCDLNVSLLCISRRSMNLQHDDSLTGRGEVRNRENREPWTDL